ncbi:MAG: acyltransferase [Methylococcales bacterium]|nr:acyltransferase [Methylococcales bacterium]
MLKTDIKKYDYIDALRGLAILAVVLVHSSQSVAPNNAILLWLMTQGQTGVQLFYIASALTLCMSWVARSSHEMFPVRNFFIRRFFRIAPLFYIAILFYISVNGFSPDYWSPNGIKWWFAPTTALFLHGFHPETINSVVPGGWSIAVEMSFYLILPFLIVKIKSIKTCLFFFIISLALYDLNKVIISHLFFYPKDQQYLVNNFSFFSFLSQLPVFLIGIFCYLILRNNYPRKQIGSIGGLLFFVLLFLFCYPSSRIPPHHFIAGGLFSVFAILLSNWPTRLLVNRVTILLGKLSFSMYLAHFAVIMYFHKLGFSNLFPKSNSASLLHFLCVILAAALVSFFLYKYIEKPGIGLGKRLIEKLDQNAARNTTITESEAFRELS